jgi:hypothetical protein
MTTSENALRIRRQGNAAIETRTTPFVQSGRLNAVLEDEGGVIVMHAGRTTLQFFIRDFAELFQGEHHAQRLLRNAVDHQDFVEIRVMRERLSYHNPAQYARIPKAT